ncbi:olfactory receptor 2Z1-like, partial [Sigmodon hispidus]
AVDHFFCDIPALMKLSCSDTSIYELALSVSGVLILMLPLILIITSYSHIFRAVLHMHSQEAQQKAFTTCSSHITVVGLFYGAAVFMYMVPGPYHSKHQDNMVSLFYCLITPTLNPLIYSLRNRE